MNLILIFILIINLDWHQYNIISAKCYNIEHRISEAIKSLASQTKPNIIKTIYKYHILLSIIKNC